jgi:hypothetical protein
MRNKTPFFLAAACVLLTVFLASAVSGQNTSTPDPFPSLPPESSKPTTQPSDTSDNQPRVYGDFAKLTLTPAQRNAIHKIQVESKAQIEKIEADAETRAILLLDPDQLKQLAELENQRKVKAKAAYEARKQKEKADMIELAKRRKEEQDAAAR